ncbi:MAG: hypothetical protein HUU20_06875 [Pirellulales bacterium]|nr:hypothetical protein [Pirellulales bacterium]
MGKLTVLAGVAFTLVTLPLHWRGSAIVVDPDYTMETLALDRDVGAVDGLRWRQGWLYLASEGSSAVYRADVRGHVELLAARDDGIASPEDLIVDDSGDVFFTDDDAGGLWRLRPGERAKRIDAPDCALAATEGIAELPSGQLLVGDAVSGRIVVLTREGRQAEIWKLAGVSKPESIAVADRGRTYVADDPSGRVWRRNADGTTAIVVDRGDGLKEPETLLYDAGVLYIVDNVAGRLLRYREGRPVQPIAQFAGRLQNIQGIAADSAGNLYLSVQADLARNQGYLLKLVRRSPAG